MTIRPATPADHGRVWDIFREVIKTGDTYVFHPDTPKADLARHWFAPHMHTYVLESEGHILGTYILKPNQPDLGDHVANASFMVHPRSQGLGIGSKLCQHALDQARELGFLSMQFNIVVSTNHAAIRLWKKHGFEIIGTVPEVFRHPREGLTDAHIMYQKL